MAEAIVLTAPQRMALMTMQSHAKQKTALDFFNEFTNMGLSQEAVTAFKEISVKTARDVGGKIIEIGKIIVMKIIEFIKENPTLSIGMAIGGAIGALAIFIPFIGAFIAPLSIALGVAAGAIIGNQVSDVNIAAIAKDLKDGTDNTSEEDMEFAEKKAEQLFDSPVTTIIKNAIDIAKKFFKLLKEIFMAIFRPEELK